MQELSEIRCMIKRFFIYSFILVTITSCDVLQSLLGSSMPSGSVPLSEAEVSEGLKTALLKGIDTSLAQLGTRDGFYKDAAIKLFLPNEANDVIATIKNIPGGNLLVSNVEMSLNRAAEAAMPEASKIFQQAVMKMQLSDVFQILNGGNQAATDYLKRQSMESIKDVFRPIVQSYVKKEYLPGISPESAYQKLIDTYNTASVGGLLWPSIKQNSLIEYTTQKACEALFTKIGAEESKIRSLSAHRVDAILKRVFGNQTTAPKSIPQL